MIWPPSVLRIRIVGKDRKRIRLWIPLFLLWPLIVFAALVVPFVIAAVPRTRRELPIKSFLTIGPWLFVIFCAMRGLKVDVRSRDEQVYIALW